MTYEIRLHPDADDYIKAQDSKSQRIIKNNLKKLEEEPYPRPNSGTGDTEKVTVNEDEYYRMHISRTHTAFYKVREDQNQVHIVNIVDIDKAHKMYD
jgi:mRNA-degrading endonuclease RelE of RelBE toxin-antitoxin system